MTYIRNHTLPFGTVHIVSDGSAITRLYTGAAEETVSCAVIDTCIRQLDEYIAGSRREFDLPAAPKGTDFQRSVWAALRTIPCGQTRTYGEIAAQLGRPKAARAVGGACNKNPILLLIPCHRVVGSDGSLTGFAAGLEVKQQLLELERE